MTRTTMADLEAALVLIKAAGYRVTKPRARPERPKTNALGLPMSENFDPKYKMRYQPSTAHLFKPYSEWFRRCLTK